MRTPNIDVSMDKPHPRFLASILRKKVRLIHGRLRYLFLQLHQGPVDVAGTMFPL